MGFGRTSASIFGMLLLCGCPKGEALSLPSANAGEPGDAAVEPRDTNTSFDARVGNVVDASRPDDGIRDLGSSDGELVDLGPPPAEGRVDVLVEAGYARNYPRTGLQVIFHSSDGAVLTTTVTNAHGRASAIVPRSGMVTVIDEPRNWYARTMTGLEPPETVRFSRVGLPEDQVPVAQTQLILPSTGPWLSFTYDNGDARRSSESLLVPLKFYDEQVPIGGRASILAFAKGRSGGPVERFSYLKDVLVTDGERIRAPEWRNDWSSVVFNWRGLAPAAPSLRLESWVGVGERTYRLSDLTEFDEQGESGLFDVDIPTGFGDWYAFRLTEHGGGRERAVFRAATSMVSSVDLDISQDNLPSVDSVDLVDGGSARPSLRYSAQDASAESDRIEAMIFYRSSAGGFAHGWIIYGAPAANGVIRLPELPASLAEHRPDEATAGFVEFVDSSRWQNYRDARRNLAGPRNGFEFRRSRMRAESR